MRSKISFTFRFVSMTRGALVSCLFSFFFREVETGKWEELKEDYGSSMVLGMT